MKIAMCPTSFAPKIGGLEIIAEMVSHALGVAGHEVTVLTLEPGPEMPGRAYRLIRNPDFSTARRVCRDADFAVMLNLGLKLAPPVLASRTPLIVWHQTGLPAGKSVAVRLKKLLLRTVVRANFGCSGYMTAGLPANRPHDTLSNPYDPNVMFEDDRVARDGDLLVLGRLVSDKGFDVVLRALALPDGPLGDARLSVVGSGPEEANLKALTQELGLTDRVSFLGPKTGAELRRELNAHKVLVVPSVWQEPFGIVALEGLACGCSVVVSAVGGLPEAVGPHGRTFKAGDPAEAARVIAEARSAPRDPDPEGRRAHLARHRADAVAARLVELSVAAIGKKRGG